MSRPHRLVAGSGPFGGRPGRRRFGILAAVRGPLRIAIAALLLAAGAAVLVWVDRPAPVVATNARQVGSTYQEQREFLRTEADYYRFDPIAGHVHVGGALRSFEWPEHATGRIEMRTNSLGFREDEPTNDRPEPGVTRILVAGDSHTDGVVWNAESFPNLLESRLNAVDRDHRYEVVNGGVGYYGPFNYLGLLRRAIDLDFGLSGYVVNLYAGNDFLDAAVVLEALGRRVVRGADYGRPIDALTPALRAGFPQHLNQAYYLATFPDMRAEVLRYTIDRFREIAALCAERKIRLLVLVQPTSLDVEHDAARDELALATLGLHPGDLEVGARLGAQLCAELQRDGVRCLDLLPSLRGSTGLFWKRDHHLGTLGHRRYAESIWQLAADDLLAMSTRPND